MKRLLSVVLVMGATIALFPKLGSPDIPGGRRVEPPRPVPLKPVPFKITSDRKTKENRLVIPRKYLQDTKVGSAGLFGDGDPGVSLRTIFAGLAISVSVISLVFLIIRKKSRAAQAIALLMTIGSVGFLCINEGRADLAPPISKVPSAWRRVGKDQQNVKIEITDKGDAVELIIGTYYKRSLPPEERHGPQVPPKTGSHPPENATRSE